MGRDLFGFEPEITRDASRLWFGLHAVIGPVLRVSLDNMSGVR